MLDPPLHHTHADGTTHAHATTLWPAVVELLQLVEDFAAGLPSDAETALRRLLQASLLHEPADWASEAAAADTAGYQHTWYRAYLAAHHEHPASLPGAPEGVYVYRPPWWPPGPAHTRAPRPPPSEAGGGPEQALRTQVSPGRLLPGSARLQPPDDLHIIREEDHTMTNQPPEEARWLLEPPQPGQINVGISIADEADVTPELREAVERLLSAAGMGEVAGYVYGNPACDPYNCSLGTCLPFTRLPTCFMFSVCRIAI